MAKKIDQRMDSKPGKVIKRKEVVEQVAMRPCSIEIARDAKGVYRWTVKAYCEPDEMIDTVSLVERVDGEMRERFGE